MILDALDFTTCTEPNRKNSYREVISYFPEALREVFLTLPLAAQESAQEIRFRTGCVPCVNGPNQVLFFTESGRWCSDIPRTRSTHYDSALLQNLLRHLCGYSVHSFTDDIAAGFVTLPGGHRVGLCGTAVVARGAIQNVRDLSSLNLRIARECPGCAAELCHRLFLAGQSPGLLVTGPPGSGKTTVLRDIALQLSSGRCGRARRVAIIDERGEIAGSRDGVPARDIGALCDVLTGYPKSAGILLALRALSPEVILCDELGATQDAEALCSGLFAGVSFIASLHAGSTEEALRRPVVSTLHREKAFAYLAQLSTRARPGLLQELTLIS